MKGIGGPLLCIGDLLSDVGDADPNSDQPPSTSSTISVSSHTLQPSDLNQLFQENYDQLNKALAGTDHSWTALTLKLCTALQTANKLIQSTNKSAELLLEKVGELERVVKRGDSAVASAKAIHISLNQKDH